MKNLILIALMAISSVVSSQSAIGTWKTIDDTDGKVKSHVSIYMQDGKLVGKVLKLITSELTVCSACKGSKQNQPIEGMGILWDLEEASSTVWDGGKILDPKNGKEYKCKLTLSDPNTLDVRGYIGFSLLGRSQTWYRVSE